MIEEMQECISFFTAAFILFLEKHMKGKRFGSKCNFLSDIPYRMEMIMDFLLNGDWLFRQKDSGEWQSAKVPGCNYLDLLRLGKIKDPFYGMNEKAAYPISLKDWEYQRDFEVDASVLESDSVLLCCDMLDTVCDVYINGEFLGFACNCHIRYEWEVKDRLKNGKNNIRIVFYSPVRYVEKKQKEEMAPPNNNGQNGIVHIRKPQCHFGWDWGPVLPPSGISGDIKLKIINGARIKDAVISQHHTDGTVSLDISCTAEKLSEEYCGYTVRIADPDGKIISEFNGAAEKEFSHKAEIVNPQLWWTHELNPVDEQPLYAVSIDLKNADGEKIDSITKKIGLRTITLDRSKDEWGSNFRFILNGVPIFVKGANWIPPDSFINRYTAQRLEYDIKAVLFSNMNMLRIWGGGYYGSDELFDLCDRCGILIWQDFQFACQAYPFFDDEFTANVLDEVEYNVKRLRHHASLAIWNGNNEIEAMSAAWLARKKYIAWTDKFFYNILPKHLEKFDDVTAYIPGSPCGVSHMKGHDRDNVGDTHLWAVWHGLQPMKYYRKRMTRFCSEFGFESLPDIKAIERFAKPSDYSLTSKVFLSHQKCLSGNMKMIYYIASRFRLPERFEDYIYLSQIAQQECIKDATEHWRRNKGRCNGAMYWQFNDCWPVCSWASMDYYGNYKALQYTSRHFNAPVMVSIQDEKDEIKIYALNDTLESGKYEAEYAVFDFDGKKYAEKKECITLGAGETSIAFVIKRSDIKTDEYVLAASLYKDGKMIDRKTYLPKEEKNLHLPKAKCALETEVKGNTAYIKVKSDKFARLVRVESDVNTLPFSDNYFDVFPDEEICITQELPDGIETEKYKRGLTVRCVQDVTAKGSRLHDDLTRLRILLGPVNFVQYLYNRNIPKDIKI